MIYNKAKMFHNEIASNNYRVNNTHKVRKCGKVTDVKHLAEFIHASYANTTDSCV
jgi:hypothetical protein